MAFNNKIDWVINGEISKGNPIGDPERTPPIGPANRPVYQVYQNTLDNKAKLDALSTVVDGTGNLLNAFSHNNLQDMQGGEADEKFHLSSAVYLDLTGTLQSEQNDRLTALEGKGHNSFSDLQGGALNNMYHLTGTQHADLISSTQASQDSRLNAIESTIGSYDLRLEGLETGSAWLTKVNGSDSGLYTDANVIGVGLELANFNPELYPTTFDHVRVGVGFGISASGNSAYHITNGYLDTNEDWVAINTAGSTLVSAEDGSWKVSVSNSTAGSVITFTDGIEVSSDGHVGFGGTPDPSYQAFINGDLSVDGNIVLLGTVDGRDLASDGGKLDGIEAGANNYSHPTGDGWNHIPTGGSAGQVLTWNASGEAIWGAAAGQVDEIIEYADYATMIANGDGNGELENKIYFTLDDDKTYRWSGSAYISISDGGIADSALKWNTARTLTLSGDLSGSVSFDGSADFSLVASLTGSYNPTIGTSSDLTTSGATILNSLTLTNGVVDTFTTRILTLANLGYTGDTDANNYIHPTGSGYNHIPSGGTVGQVIINTANGEGTWQDLPSDLWTADTYGATYGSHIGVGVASEQYYSISANKTIKVSEYGINTLLGQSSTAGMVGTYTNHPFFLATNGSYAAYIDTDQSIKISTSPTTFTPDDASGTVDNKLMVDGDINLASGKGIYINGVPYSTGGNSTIGTSTDLTTTGATVVGTLSLTDGVITAHTTRTLTLANLGYTGATDANNYVHPTTSGNKHLPSGGSVGQVLTNTADGTGTWQDASSSSVWTEDTYGATYANNIGIGTASEEFFSISATKTVKVASSGISTYMGNSSTAGMIGTYTNHPFFIATNGSYGVYVDENQKVSISNSPTTFAPDDASGTIDNKLIIDGDVNLAAGKGFYVDGVPVGGSGGGLTVLSSGTQISAINMFSLTHIANGWRDLNRTTLGIPSGTIPYVKIVAKETGATYNAYPQVFISALSSETTYRDADRVCGSLVKDGTVTAPASTALYTGLLIPTLGDPTGTFYIKMVGGGEGGTTLTCEIFVLGYYTP